MSFSKTLLKVEDPAGYAAKANKGVMLAYPVKIHGKSHRSDNGVGYHSTIKEFDREKDHPHSIHALARHLPLNPPDAKNTQVKFENFKSREGKDIYAITLHGNSAEKQKEHRAKFAHMGHPDSFVWQPHISVDKNTWDKLKSLNPKTAHDAGISFDSAQLKQGPSALKTYKHAHDTSDPKVPDESDLTAKVNIAKSAPLLEKGALKNAGVALGMATALAGHSSPHQTPHKESNRSPASISEPAAPKYDHSKMLRTIAEVESGNKTDVDHKAMGGMHNGGHAYGKYGLTEPTIKDAIKAHKDLKSKHGKALALSGKNLHNYMHDNKGLEDIIADRHLAHMEHVLGNSPEHLGYGWLTGIQGALQAQKSGTDINNHWHAKKIRAAYDKGK